MIEARLTNLRNELITLLFWYNPQVIVKLS